jgi:hypothetical protein
MSGDTVPTGEPDSRAYEEPTPHESELKGHPRPGRFARIADPTKITAEVSISQTEIHRYLTEHMALAGQKGVPTYGTIGRIIKGNTGSYENVNWVFTAINMRYRSFSRRDIVFVSSRKGQDPSVDDNLKYAVVFPGLTRIMDELDITEPGLSKLAFTTRQEELDLIGSSNVPADVRKAVRPIYINRMKAGYPVRRDKVLGVIRALNEQFEWGLDFDVATCR